MLHQIWNKELPVFENLDGDHSFAEKATMLRVVSLLNENFSQIGSEVNNDF